MQAPGLGIAQALRIVGTGPEFFRRLPHTLTELSARFGPVARFDVPLRRFYFISDPDLVKEVLVTKQHEFIKSEGTRAIGRLLGDGLLTSEEPQHRRMRRIVQPAFHRERIAAYETIMLAESERFVRDLTVDAEFDMHEAMMALTLRIACAALFGVDAPEVAATVRDALDAVIEVFPLSLGPIGRLRSLLPVASTRRFHAAKAALEGIVDEIIGRRRRDGVDRGDVVSMLLAARDEEGDPSVDVQQLREEMLTLLIAGHETTANALSWTWYLLSRHADVEARLHRELPDRSFARSIIAESMRLYPPAWVLGRQAVRDVRIGEYDIGRGAVVLVSPLVMQRSARHFPDPERFDPDRWAGSAEPHPFAYFPFGGGARKCIGEQFAWSEATIVLAAVAGRMRFSLQRRTVVEWEPLVTLRPRYPMWMTAHPVAETPGLPLGK